MALTRITKGVIKPNENYDTHNINSTGIVTAIGLDVNGNGDISGNLSVGGVLTYEDVTSIDSVGIITAQKDIHVGAGVSVVGIVTATTFKGDGDFVDLDVDGHTNLDNVSVAGVTTFSDTIRVGTGVTIESNGQAEIAGITTFYKDVKIKSGTNRLYLGTGDQLSLIADPSHSYLRNSGGHFQIHSNNFSVRSYDGNGSIPMFYSPVSDGNEGGGPRLYHNHGAGIILERLRTTKSGVNIVGTTTSTQLAITGVSTFTGAIDANGDLDVDGHTNLDNVSITGITTFSNVVTKFSSGNGGNTHIQVLSTGSGEAGIFFDAANGDISGSDYIFIGQQNNLDFVIKANPNAGNIDFQRGTDTKVRIDTSGNLNVNYDLDVDGHTNLDNVSVAGVSTHSNHIDLPDDALLRLGVKDTNPGGELTIEHSSSNVNYIKSPSNRTLQILGNGGVLMRGGGNENIAYFLQSSVKLYQNQGLKLETTSKGIEVGVGVTIETNGQATFTGIVTASSFKLSDGSTVGFSPDAQNNLFAGTDAGASLNSSSSNNVLFGQDAGDSITEGEYNVCIGLRAGQALTDVDKNVCIGNDAGKNNNSSSNVFIGWYAGAGAGSNGNVCIGHNAGTESNGNETSYGYSSGPTGSYSGNTNVCMGFASGNGLRSSASRNTILGPGAGRNDSLGQVNINGSDNIILGSYSSVSSVSASNECVIGAVYGSSKAINHFRIPGIGCSISEGGAVITGIVTATSFSGDGSNLSNLPASAPVGGASTNAVFFENDVAVAVNYQITSNKNAMSAGPIAINAGIAVTVPSGSSWTIV